MRVHTSITILFCSFITTCNSAAHILLKVNHFFVLYFFFNVSQNNFGSTNYIEYTQYRLQLYEQGTKITCVNIKYHEVIYCTKTLTEVRWHDKLKKSSYRNGKLHGDNLTYSSVNTSENTLNSFKMSARREWPLANRYIN